MNKNELSTIKETIEDLIKLRKVQYDNYVDQLIEKEWIADTFTVSSSFQEDNNFSKGKWVSKQDEIDDDNPFLTKNDNPSSFNNKNDNEEYNADENILWDKFITEFDPTLVKLNNLLEENDKVDEVLEIEKKIAVINNKRFLNVKEFVIKYGMSKSSQQHYRTKLPHNNPLPYHQNGENGKITYDVQEVQTWMENNNTAR